LREMKREAKNATYSMKAAAELTDVPATTLRHWEKTFSLIVPERTQGGHRLYSQEDIERIKWLKHQIDHEGVQASVAHRLLEQELRKAGGVGRATAKGAILILVAEKDPITAELEEHFLNREGYDVHIVLDGRRAVDEAEKMQPDLIVLDIILPGLSGLKVCQALKRNPATASIPVLVFSVLDVRERALQAGADAFLLKPIEPAKLIKSVKALLKKPVPGRDS
jgi:CheY-like chemotaxis protein